MYFCNMIFRHLLNMRSHPTWVRGLKPFLVDQSKETLKSHPTWVRGLKQRNSQKNRNLYRRTLRGCVD